VWTNLRCKVAAVSAGTLLMFGGAAPVLIAHAQASTPATPAAVTAQVEDPSTGPDLDNVQQAVGDQVGSQVEDGLPDTGANAEVKAPDHDAVQQGAGAQIEDGLPDTGISGAED
jgi:hypothetical protein